MGKVFDEVGDAFSSVGHAISKGVKSIGHGLGSFGHSFGRGLTKVAKKTGKAVEKGVKKAVKPVGNIIQSGINTVKETAKGNIGRAISNYGNLLTLGSVDLTGEQRGIVNVDATKYARQAAAGIAGIKKPKTSTSTSSAETYQPIQLAKASTSQVMQLRKGRGLVGGGSYSETVKNPLGGSAGKTGK